jgi:predicted ATPase
MALNEEARGRARACAHPFSVAFALLYSAIIASFRKEPTVVQEHAAALAALCKEQGFAYRLAQSQILDGWVRATRDGDAGAIRTIQAGIEKTRATGAQVLLPYYLALLTEAALVLQEMPLGLSTAREALAVVQRTGECFFQAELERLNGELLHASGAERGEVAAWLSRSLSTARRQSARSFELRTLNSLARLAPEGLADRLHVAEVLHLFGEGVDTPDTRAARELLKQFA